MIQAVIFDLDGVIVSTDELHYRAWKKMADKHGIEFNHEINHRLRGVSRMASLEIVLEKASKPFSDQDKEEMASSKNQDYVNLLKNLTEENILPHVKEVLFSLKDRGIRIAIGSSSKNAKLILKQIGLFELFDVIADGNDIIHSKPDPEIFIKASEKLGISRNLCAVVEDAVAGINAAKAAGMLAFAIEDAIKSDVADYKINDLREILDLI
jgi:beta-phosphoglucomutase